MRSDKYAPCHVIRTQVLDGHGVCCKCGECVVVSNDDKKSSRFPVCPKCNSNRAKLSMHFGGWPPAPFKAMPPAAQKQFWKDCRGALNRGALENTLVKNIVEAEINQDVNRLGGKFLPLSMYIAMGLTKKEVDPGIGAHYI